MREQRQQPQAAAEEGAANGVPRSMDGAEGSGPEGERDAPLSAEEFTSQVRTFVCLLDKRDVSLERAVAGHVVCKNWLRAWGTKLRRYLLLGFRSCECQSRARALFRPVPASSFGSRRRPGDK